MENEICRICLNNSVTLVDIFARRDQVDTSKPEPCLAEMLNECADCRIECNDQLPQQICIGCVLSAQNAFRFKRLCERSYEQLVTQRKNKQEEMRQLQDQDQIEFFPMPQIKCEIDIPQINKSEIARSTWQPKVKLKAKRLPDVLVVKQEQETTSSTAHKCKICDKEFTHLRLLRMHSKWHVNSLPEPKYSKKTNKLRNENRSKINDAPSKRKSVEMESNTCLNCARTFKKFSQYSKHLKAHEDKNGIHCPHCSKVLGNASRLKRHIRIHTGERPYTCPFCPESFQRCDYRKNHIKKVHGDPKSSKKTLHKNII